MADGFLGRWSKRKAGKEVAEPVPPEKKLEVPKESSQASPVEIAPEDAPPPATLEDVAKIDRFDPDFSAFMKPDVDPAVQQAALKKMFTDPHFNIMDGLDIYIDDYSKPDPLPPGMLERMVQSDMLNLFRKPADELAKEANQEANQEQKQANQQTAEKQLQDDSLGVQNQTDLTSPHSSSDKRSDELEKLPVEPAQKKT